MGTQPERADNSATLRYHDAPGAIRFLTEALGLTAGEITYGPDDRVVHAELGWGNGT